MRIGITSEDENSKMNKKEEKQRNGKGGHSDDIQERVKVVEDILANVLFEKRERREKIAGVAV